MSPAPVLRATAEAAATPVRRRNARRLKDICIDASCSTIYSFFGKNMLEYVDPDCLTSVRAWGCPPPVPLQPPQQRVDLPLVPKSAWLRYRGGAEGIICRSKRFVKPLRSAL